MFLDLLDSGPWVLQGLHVPREVRVEDDHHADHGGEAMDDVLPAHAVGQGQQLRQLQWRGSLVSRLPITYQEQSAYAARLRRREIEALLATCHGKNLLRSRQGPSAYC